jgi:hypothetical protein
VHLNAIEAWAASPLTRSLGARIDLGKTYNLVAKPRANKSKENQGNPRKKGLDFPDNTTRFVYLSHLLTMLLVVRTSIGKVALGKALLRPIGQYSSWAGFLPGIFSIVKPQN